MVSIRVYQALYSARFARFSPGFHHFHPPGDRDPSWTGKGFDLVHPGRGTAPWDLGPLVPYS